MSEQRYNDVTESILKALDDPAPAANQPSGDTETEVLKRLDAEPAPAKESPEGGDTKPDQGTGETAPDTTAETVEPAAEQAIEPPASWKADAKERFAKLPRDLQKTIADRESERERGLTKSQQESADARKAAAAERESVQAERNAYVTRLNTLIDMANTMDPVLAEGRKTDWAALSKTDPLGAQTKWFEFQQRSAQIQALANERDGIAQRSKLENFKRHDTALREKLPEIWADDGKRTAFQSEFGKYLTEQGFSAQEAGGIDDHRAILLGRKAMLYDKLMAEQSRIATTKAKPQPTKTMRTQAQEDQPENARAEALKRTALRSGRTDDAAAAVLASL